MTRRNDDRPRNIDDDDDIKGRREDESDDAYSVQPASGSVIGGRRGMREYGLTGEIAQNESHSKHATPASETVEGDISLESDPSPYGAVEKGFAGLSEYSSERARPDEIMEAREESRDISMTDENLRSRIEKLLDSHENIDRRELKIDVHDGEVHLEGVLHSHAAKLNIEEVLEALPGVKQIRDDVRVVI